MHFKRIIAVCAVIFSLALHAKVKSIANPTVKIFHNAKIFTSDTNQLLINDGGIVVVNNYILAVGTSQQALSYTNIFSEAEIIDLEGKVMLPGFNDSHVHPFDYFSYPQYGGNGVIANDNSFIPGPGPSFQEVLDDIEATAQVTPAGKWIFAFIGTQILEDTSVSRLAIDAVAPNNPVVLASWFGHGTIVNTNTINTIGLSLMEADPPGGFYGRFESGPLAGQLNGVVKEYAEHAIRRYFASQMTDQQLISLFEDYALLAAQSGYTTLQEFAVGIPQERHLDIIRQANTVLRVRAHCFPMALDEECAVPSDFSPAVPGSKKYAGGVKWIDDGTPIERFTFLRNEYEDAPGVFGMPNFTPDEIKQQFERAASTPLYLKRRNQLMVHQTGDALADLMFMKQQEVNADPSFWADRRPRLEHALVLQPDQIQVAAQYGWTIVTNPIFFSLPDLWNARLGPVQEAGLWPVKSILDAGATLAMGSDAVTVVRGPFIDLFFAQINPSNPAEAISLEEAIIAYTLGSAKAEFKEHVKGTIGTLKLADFVVLNQDIFNLPSPDAILGTQVLLTVVNGEVVHEVPGSIKRTKN